MSLFPNALHKAGDARGVRDGPIEHRGLIRRAFTIIEMLVVISIIAILVVIAVPSFQAMVSSSEESLAESLLRSAVRAGRDAALRGGAGEDGAVVFFFEPGGRTVLVPYISVGTLRDSLLPGSPLPNGPEVLREVFVPSPAGQPVRLPKYWMVRAQALSGLLDSGSSTSSGWYNKFSGGGGTLANDRYDRGQVNWVFPETDFFNAGVPNDGAHRNTFMLRFEGGTGRRVTSPIEGALVFAPGRVVNPPSLYANTSGPARQSTNTLIAQLRKGDPERYVRQVLAGRLPGVAAPLTEDQKRALIGRESSDMVLARPVSVIALYNERDLVAGLNQLGGASDVALDRDTDSLYEKPLISGVNSTDVPTPNPGPILVSALSGQARWRQINQWIEGDTDGDNTYGDTAPDAAGAVKDRPTAKLYLVDRFTGSLRRLSVDRGQP